LLPNQNFKEFDGCQVKNLNKKKTILIWGDSHAAHLYPGLKKRYDLDSNIIQYTASGCPPILDIDIPDRPNCRAINDFVLSKIKNETDDIVVLSAAWTNYDLSNLVSTISLLSRIGFKKVYLIGPVPQWNDGLPKQLVKQYLKSFPHSIPSRMRTGLSQNFIDLDKTLRKRIDTSGAIYISAKEILCDKNGCITKINDTNDSLTAWDYGHLTNFGSEFLVGKFPNL
jgi:hypothetical protein